MSSGIDAALHVVERLSGPEWARTVALTLEYDWDREQGFVRGVMADRYIERASMQFPEGSRFERILAYGDQTGWTEQYRVSATAPVERYLQAIAAVYTEPRGWTTESVGERQVLLRSKAEQGRTVLLRVSADPLPQPQTFDLKVDIEVK